MENVDLIVIGGGKAGKSLAMNRAAAGWTVALIERQYVGGTCINVACIPTKTLVTSARRLTDARTAASVGILGTEGARVDVDALRARKDGVVGAMVGAHEKMFAAPGIDFIRGTAVFTGPHSVKVTGEDGTVRELTSERIVVNVGSRPFRPEIPGLWEAGAWTNEEILRLEEIPASLAVIGAGPIGLEFAQMMATFGSRVTLLDAGERVLAREDADLSETIEGILTGAGVSVRHEVRVESAEKVDELTRLHLSDGTTLDVDRVLVATGRVPNTDGINAEAAGLALDERGFVVVDDEMRTSVDGVWAAGDCAGTPMFTHASWHDHRLILAQMKGETDPALTSKAGRVIPWSLFTTPEVARIGLSAGQAEAEGREVVTVKIPTAAVPRARTLGEMDGWWQMVVDARTREILGATVVGTEASEVITAVQVAMAAGLTADELRRLPIAHPTMGEGLNILLDQLG